MSTYRIEIVKHEGDASVSANLLTGSNREALIQIVATDIVSYMSKGIADKARAAETSVRAVFGRADLWADDYAAGVVDLMPAGNTHAVRGKRGQRKAHVKVTRFDG